MRQKAGIRDRGRDRKNTGPRPTLGQTIRRARTEKELTLKEVAEGLELHLAYLIDSEKAVRKRLLADDPRLESLVRVLSENPL